MTNHLKTESNCSSLKTSMKKCQKIFSDSRFKMKKKEYFLKSNILTELWNSFPKDAKEDKSINDFKIKLDNFIEEQSIGLNTISGLKCPLGIDYQDPADFRKDHLHGLNLDSFCTNIPLSLLLIQCQGRTLRSREKSPFWLNMTVLSSWYQSYSSCGE